MLLSMCLAVDVMQAVEYVKSGMVLGLGTGSTAAFAVAKIGELLKVWISVTSIRNLNDGDVSMESCHFTSEP